MTPTRARLGFAAFAVLTGALATNVFVLQPPGRRLPSMADTRTDDVKGSLMGAVAITPQAAPSSEEAASPSQAPPSTSSELIRAIQRELKARGYETGPIDGQASPVTRAAILAYEVDNGLSPSAEPDEALLHYIVLGASSDSPSRPDATPSSAVGDLVRSVQTSLSRLGYAPGPETGTITDDTTAAIRKFEADQRMKETGRISGELVARLTALAGR